MRRAGCFALVWAVAPLAAAQAPGQAAAALPQDDTTTIDTIRVTAPRLETVDLYGFRNPVQAEPSRFDRHWKEPFKLRKIGMEGGFVPLLSRYAAEKIAAGARKIPGWKGPVQPAIARPPPLTGAQMERAAELQDASPQ